MISWSPERVSEKVKACLQSHRNEVGEYQFDVPAGLVRQDADYWYVPVVPDRLVENKNVFYDLLNRIEDEIEQQHHIQVMLVPTAPDE